MPTPLAGWAVAAALSLYHCDDSISDCFCFGAMDRNCSYFVQMSYMIFRTSGELLSKALNEGLGEFLRISQYQLYVYLHLYNNAKEDKEDIDNQIE